MSYLLAKAERCVVYQPPDRLLMLQSFAQNQPRSPMNSYVETFVLNFP
ncbi:MAG: hypothetical protein KME12_13915 [Trichocoleus desertorum ATA4-8-CV12]|nr:hypothetical protein [Trichocoleus desertorum ATA4-8-CV12]